jgi:PIN domain nuclease of toxin-antitoxin system
VKFLLDTHILIWAAIAPHKISSELSSLLSDPSNYLYFSSASIWEISIKESMGKKDFKVSTKKLHEGLVENGYKEIKVSALHAMEVIKLPFIHRDPFDRILVATAIWENMPLLTNDSTLSPYHSLVRVL